MKNVGSWDRALRVLLGLAALSLIYFLTGYWSAYLDAEDNGETDMFISGWGNATGDADYNQYNLFHSASLGKGGNTTFYVNPEVDKLIEQGRREQDTEKRKQIYAQFCQ